MAWNDLTLPDKARMITLAVRSGITDLKTIQEVYNTYAYGGQRQTFKEWKEKMAAHKGINMDDPDYDYEGFYNENPQRAWEMLNDNPKAHFTDKYKTQSHPTLSSESIYSNGRGGTWRGNTFELSDYLMEDSDRTVEYLRRNDPDVTPTYRGGIVLDSAKVTANKYGRGGKKNTNAYSERIRSNDSPTAAESELIEHEIHNRQMRRNTSPEEYFIPYDLSKEITVPGVGRVSTNMLDSLAKYSLKVGVPIEEGIGLAAEETKFGALPNWSLQPALARQEKEMGRKLTPEEIKEFQRTAYNASVARNYGGIYPQFLINDHDWDDRGWEKSPEYAAILNPIESPLEHGYTLYKKGLYNKGMEGHTQKVKDTGNRLFKTKAIQNWWDNSEFNPKNQK